jgi:hypothetical protein
MDWVCVLSPSDGSARVRGWRVLQLQWRKCTGGEWCRLIEVDLAKIDPFGVFILWRNGNAGIAPVVLHVGRGSLRDEIARCRREPIYHGSLEHLFITWASVDDPRMLEAVAAYLYQHLRPIWGDVTSSATVLPVNLPLTA